MDLHCFISIESVLTEIKTREIKEETYKNAKKKNQAEFSSGKCQRTRKSEEIFPVPTAEVVLQGLLQLK